MLGWFREEIVRASRSKRSLASALSARCCGRILTATLRSSRGSRARYTSPISPAPSGATILYGPSFVLEESPIARDYTRDDFEASCTWPAGIATHRRFEREAESILWF